MSHPHNYLRFYRKKSPLKLSDIGFLLSITDPSTLSRYEKGQRTPSIEFSIVYHLMFNTTIESLHEPQSEYLLARIIERLELLIIGLKEEKSLGKNRHRIKYLEEVFKRLTN